MDLTPYDTHSMLMNKKCDPEILVQFRDFHITTFTFQIVFAVCSSDLEHASIATIRHFVLMPFLPPLSSPSSRQCGQIAHRRP